MAVHPADLVKISHQFAGCSQATVDFFDSVDRLITEMHLNDHPEAIDIKFLISFRKLIVQEKLEWDAYRKELIRTTNSLAVMTHLWGAEDVAIIPVEELELLTTAARSRILPQQASGELPVIDTTRPSHALPVADVASVADWSNLIASILFALGGFLTLGVAIGSMWR